MQLKVFDGPIKTSQAQYDYIMKRIGGAARRLSSPNAIIEVRLGDINGPRGGLDKHCAVLVSAPGLQPIRVQERAADYYSAIDRVAGVLKRAVARTVERVKTSRRR